MKNQIAWMSIALALSGCASIVSSTYEPVRITSKPSGAEYMIRNAKGQIIQTGKTPASIILKKSDGFFDGADYFVTYTKAGYQPGAAGINTKVSLWYALGNLTFGGPLGYLFVDPITGAMWTFGEEACDITLLPDYLRNYGRDDLSRADSSSD